MEVEILHVADCPNLELARRRVAEAARRAGIDRVAVRERAVASVADAAAAGMRGSPTVVVGGVDVADGGAVSLACRLYPGAERYEGAPSVEAIATALTRGAGGSTDANRG